MNWPYELGASVSTLQHCFEQVVAHFQRPLAQFLYRFVFRQEVAIDLTQETFVKAYLNLHQYENDRPFSTWLFSIGSNLAKDHLRKTSRVTEVPFDEDFSEDPETRFRQPDHQLDATELGDAIETAIAALPLLYREPLLLRHSAGMSIEQIAEVLGTSDGVVKTRLFRARAQLQDLLGKEWLSR